MAWSPVRWGVDRCPAAPDEEQEKTEAQPDLPEDLTARAEIRDTLSGIHWATVATTMGNENRTSPFNRFLSW